MKRPLRRHRISFIALGFVTAVSLGLILANLVSQDQSEKRLMERETTFRQEISALQSQVADLRTELADKELKLTKATEVQAAAIQWILRLEDEKKFLMTQTRSTPKPPAAAPVRSREETADAALLARQLHDWQPVAEWSGSGTRVTEAFAVNAGQWRLNWRQTSANPFVDDEPVRIDVWDERGNVVKSIGGNGDVIGKDISVYFDKRGTYRIAVSGTTSRWTANVESRELRNAELGTFDDEVEDNRSAVIATFTR